LPAKIVFQHDNYPVGFALVLLMPVPSFIEQGYLRLTDAVFDRIQRPMPSQHRLQQCKIISHRGAHDNRQVKENTIAAFTKAKNAGVWGLELDIRWTRDLEPVVFHDEDLLRMYGIAKNISTFTLNELKHQYPAIPPLSDMVNQFGKKCHLMIEIKRQPWLDRIKQMRRLEKILSPMKPMEHYHLITCHPETLSPLKKIPSRAKVAVAQYHPIHLSRWVKHHQWGGLCGHYFLIGNKAIETHHRLGQKIGTGFPQTRNSLFREVNRGIDWIFSNDAVRLQQILNACLIADVHPIDK
jgi:glycerophosphoryl diester phosphodiesterase